MKFIHRLGYYLGGFSIGLVLLMFFLNGKDASCDYGPNARTVKSISSKPMSYSDHALIFMDRNTIDSTTILNLIKYGSVDFSESDTELDSCKVYQINNSYKERDMTLKVKNCEYKATLLDINYTDI
jgi:hypothetical protein